MHDILLADLNYLERMISSSFTMSAKWNIARGVFRTSAASEMEFFVIIVYSLKSLTVFTENSVLNIFGVLDAPLITSGLSMTSN